MGFVYRRKYWLRQAVQQEVLQWKPHIKTPCAALHVRRSDVTLEGSGRGYHNLSEYLVQAQPALQLMGLQSILLLSGERALLPTNAFRCSIDSYYCW
jgi:hypothetical protein